MMKVQDRFLKYISFDTQSDDRSETSPSTEKQLLLAKELLAELQELGASGAELDENGYVYATIPASEGSEGRPVLVLVAHMDTALDMSGKDVKARIIENYDGKDILLNQELSIVTKTEDFPALKKYVGQDLIVTDGTTLLGADDKAGIAEIMTAAELMLAGQIRHPEVRIVFTPDEEIGRGVEHINMEKVRASYGYTVDGEEIGQLEYENFNAASAEVTVHGVCVHTGSAFGIMKNALLIGMEYQSLLPVFENPASTEGRMGFYHLNEMEGKVETAKLSYILRDHDAGKLKEKMELMKKAAAFLNEKYGEGTVEISFKDSYRNMYEKIVPEHEELISYARDAILAAGVTPIEDPIRGGTDGATLSYMGLPCPNLGTGGHACHGRHEFIPIQSMEKSVEILKNLVEKFA